MGNSRQRSNSARWLGALAGVCLLLGSAGPAGATLISVDWKSYGDGLLTLDTQTGLEWLDVTYTAGMSYMDVRGQLAETDADLYGFQYADNSTGDHLLEFILNGLGLELGESFTEEEIYEPMLNLLSQVGVTRPIPGGEGWGTMGMRRDLGGPGTERYDFCLVDECVSRDTADQVSVAFLMINELGVGNRGRFETGYTTQPLGTRDDVIGSFLYRAARVPDAPISLLLGLGLLFVGLAARRSKTAPHRR